LQLPPVSEDKDKTDWLFYSPMWAEFAKNTITLKTQHRFVNEDYIRGMNCLRRGNAKTAIKHLRKAGVKFLPYGTKSDKAPGTIIVGKKDQRTIFNTKRYATLKTTKEAIYMTECGGQQLKEWSENEIPASITLKVGARVMITRNLYDKPNEDGSQGKLLQANGELGTVKKLLEDAVLVERDDNSVVLVEMFELENSTKHKGHDGSQHFVVIDEQATGYICYMPLTLAWAMNVHKCQGLTLFHHTRVVIEYNFRYPAMAYVAASRVADPKHLAFVGADTKVLEYGSKETIEMWDEPRLVEHCNMDLNCKAFL
jgi:ATP-dependent exoDNAse (exonuclease V) alpha subunit